MAKPKRKERRHFYDYVGEVARQLWLGSWEFTHQWHEYEEEEDGRIWAETNHLPEYRRATITWNPILLGFPPQEIRATVVHELLHCQHAHLDHFIESLIAPCSAECSDLHHARHRGLTEENNVVMERLISPSMPLYVPYSAGRPRTAYT